MKRSKKKLALSRETLRGLMARDLAGIRGGSVATCRSCDSCKATCDCDTIGCPPPPSQACQASTVQTMGGLCTSLSFSANGP